MSNRAYLVLWIGIEKPWPEWLRALLDKGMPGWNQPDSMIGCIGVAKSIP